MIQVEILTVLYENSPVVLDRFAASVAKSAAFQDDDAPRFVLRLGDCSPHPCVKDSSLERWRTFDSSAPSRLTIEYHPWGQNLHHSRGINTLAQMATGDLLVITNPDQILLRDTLAHLLRGDCMREVREARQFPFEHPKPYLASSGESSWCSGAMVSIARRAFEELGGFDAGLFPSYGNDVDLSWRARQLGYRSRTVVNAHVFHDKRYSVADSSPTPTSLERVEGAVSYLLLAQKYGWHQELQNSLDWIRTHRPDDSREIFALFEERQWVETNHRDSSGVPLFAVAGGSAGPRRDEDLFWALRDAESRYGVAGHPDDSEAEPC